MAFGITTFAESPFSATGSTSVNVALTGQALTCNQGNEGIVIDVSFSVTGQALTVDLGTATLDANSLIDVTGQALSSNLASVTTAANADVSITGQALTSTLGTAEGGVVTIASPPIVTGKHLLNC